MATSPSESDDLLLSLGPPVISRSKQPRHFVFRLHTMPEIAISDKQQSKLWINDAIGYVVRKFERDPLSDEELSQAEFEVLKQLVESINHRLRGLELDCVKRNREDSGNEPGENLPIQHICRKCWIGSSQSPREAQKSRLWETRVISSMVQR